MNRTRVTRHIKNIFEDMELDEKSNLRKTHFPFFDRFLILDDDIYSIGSSIKDVGKKRFVMTKLSSINKDDLLKNL